MSHHDNSIHFYIYIYVYCIYREEKWKLKHDDYQFSERQLAHTDGEDYSER